MTTEQKTTTTDVQSASDMEQFKTTPYYQSLGIEDLQQQLGTYTTDDAALRQQAENQYKPVYDAEIEALRQQLEQQKQGYEEQRSGMGAQYDRQRRSTNQAYDESAVELNNVLTKRGLGRSSLVSTQGAYLENQRAQALGDIDRDETAAINAINERIALLTDQAARSERTLAGNYARQLDERVEALRRQNNSAAIDLQLQIAALQQQGYEAYQKWLMDNRKQQLAEKEFEEKYGDKKNTSSGSSSASKKKTTATAAKPAAAQSAQPTVGGILPAIVESAQKVAQRLGSLSGKTSGAKKLGKGKQIPVK